MPSRLTAGLQGAAGGFALAMLAGALGAISALHELSSTTPASGGPLEESRALAEAISEGLMWNAAAIVIFVPLGAATFFWRAHRTTRTVRDEPCRRD